MLHVKALRVNAVNDNVGALEHRDHTKEALNEGRLAGAGAAADANLLAGGEGDVEILNDDWEVGAVLSLHVLELYNRHARPPDGGDAGPANLGRGGAVVVDAGDRVEGEGEGSELLHHV